MTAEEKIHAKRDALIGLAGTDLNSARWAEALLDAAGIAYTCAACGGPLNPAGRDELYECADCGEGVTEVAVA